MLLPFGLAAGRLDGFSAAFEQRAGHYEVL